MTKRLLFILSVLIFLIASHNSNAQIIKGEAFLGLNMSQVDGDEVVGFKKFGFYGGLGAIVPIYKKNNFTFEGCIEVVFNQKGSHQRQQYIDNGDGKTGEYDLFMNYAEVPIMLYFTDKQVTSFGLGFSYGRLVGLREYEHGVRTNVTVNSGEYNPNDYSILAEVKLRLYERLKLGVRYQYSLAKIRTRDFTYIDDSYTWTRDQYNNLFTVRLIWVFNENRDEFFREEYRFDGDPKFHRKAIERKLKKLRKKEAREERRENMNN